MTSRLLPALAALNGVLAIGFGAFGAHGLTDPQAKAWAATAAQFQLPQAIAVLALLAWRDSAATRTVGWLFGLGALVFASALDALALGAPRAVAMLAPLGGGAMLIGWLTLLAISLKRQSR